jgi:MYXO-CTERM domain-containing protein
MKSLTTSLIVFSLLGSAGAALACSQVLDAQTVPSSWQEGTIPVDGFIYVASGDEPTFDEQYTSIIDPEGAPVIWEFVDMEFSSGVLGVQPEGGWLLGDYAGASWSSEGLFRTVVDTVDTTAPDIGIDSWEGQSKQPASLVMVDSCGGGGARSAGLVVTMTPPSEPVLYVVDVDHLGPVAWDSSEQLAFWDSFLVTTAQSDKVDVTITGFDLSGNSSTVELLSARGCAGSGSSLAAGHGNGGLALASLLALAVLRRRRDRLEPTKV